MIAESIGSLLHQCCKTRSFRHGLSLHAAVFKTGMLSDVIISNHILNLYAKCKKINSARQVFDKMPERNLVTWSAMISGYDQAGKPLAALQLYSRMQLECNEYVYGSVISSCASLLEMRLGKQVHAQSLKFGYSTVSFVSNSLVSMYMKCRQPGDALLVFSDADEPNPVAYNAIITGLVENQLVERGFEVFRLMSRQGLIPNRFTFVGLLGSCCTSDDLTIGMELHCQTIKLKLDSSNFIGNVIVTMYSKFNLLEDAEKVFRLIEEKDVISWNTFIASCCHCLDHAKGLTVFREMLKSEVHPDDFTFTSALAAYSGIASVTHGRQIHAHLIRTTMNDDMVVVGNALVNMYAKCGCIEHALAAFNRMGCHNLISWNTIIAGFANHGLGRRALDLFEQMKELGINPDSVTFISLLVACNHAGLVNEGEAYFKSMEKIYRIAPDIEHVSCIVDLLGRAGRLMEAEEYMDKYSFGHDPIILGCLLSASRLHGDVMVGERLAKRLLEVQPATTSPYVLLSNLYASDSMWDGVAEARGMLKGRGLKKEPGHSLIEIKGIVEKFTVGSSTHLRIKEILDLLKTLSWQEDEFVLLS